jgi:hypothetical protein
MDKRKHISIIILVLLKDSADDDHRMSPQNVNNDLPAKLG